jgi:hypothetical protein
VRQLATVAPGEPVEVVDIADTMIGRVTATITTTADDATDTVIDNVPPIPADALDDSYDAGPDAPAADPITGRVPVRLDDSPAAIGALVIRLLNDTVEPDWLAYAQAAGLDEAVTHAGLEALRRAEP